MHSQPIAETSSDNSSKPIALANPLPFGVVLAITGTFLFALKSIFIKLAFAAGVTPTSLLTLRMVFSLPFYAFVLFRVLQRGTDRPISKTLVLRSLGLGFLGYYLASFLDLSGLDLISAQLERLTLFTYPALISILAWVFLGEKLTRRMIAAIVLSYAGVVLMYFGEQTFASGENVRVGVLLVMGAAICYSVYVLFAKPTIQAIGSPAFTSLAMIGSTFFVLVHFACTESMNDIQKLDKIVFFYAAILAFVCTVLPSFMINEAIARIGAARTSVIGSVGPVLTMGLAICVLGEPTSPRHVAGMVVAVLGVSLVVRK